MNVVKIKKALMEQKNLDLSGNLYCKTQTLFAYNSNKIEGSTTTLEETESIYDTGTILANEEKVIVIKDVTEIKNHFTLFKYMLDNVDEELSIDMIKKFHYILKDGTLTESEKSWFNVGEFKKLKNNGRVGRMIMFKECLHNDIIPFYIEDRNKAFYARGLKEYQTKNYKGYLIDTCLNSQDNYTEMAKYFLEEN